MSFSVCGCAYVTCCPDSHQKATQPITYTHHKLHEHDSHHHRRRELYTLRTHEGTDTAGGPEPSASFVALRYDRTRSKEGTRTHTRYGSRSLSNRSAHTPCAHTSYYVDGRDGEGSKEDLVRLVSGSIQVTQANSSNFRSTPVGHQIVCYSETHLQQSMVKYPQAKHVHTCVRLFSQEQSTGLSLWLCNLFNYQLTLL